MHSKLASLVLLGTALFPQLLVAQGSLTAPGAPAPTLKSLSQIEPRLPISTFGTNLLIPGSYYLTTNLFAGTNAGDGINIPTGAHDITLDLNGFSMTSTNAFAGSPAGVRITNATNVFVHNGRIIGFDRGVRAEFAFNRVVVEELQVSGSSRAGIEANTVSGDNGATFTARRCIVEAIDAGGEGTSAAADGIAALTCTVSISDCIVRRIVPAGTGTGSCIDLVSCTNSFVDNNLMVDAQFGLRITGGGTRVYYRNNLTAGCGAPFSSSGGVDRGGNF